MIRIKKYYLVFENNIRFSKTAVVDELCMFMRKGVCCKHYVTSIVKSVLLTYRLVTDNARLGNLLKGIISQSAD